MRRGVDPDVSCKVMIEHVDGTAVTHGVGNELLDAKQRGGICLPVCMTCKVGSCVSLMVVKVQA